MIMMKEYFVLAIRDDIEPEIHGPYPSEGHRDLAARQIRIEGDGDDGVFALTTSTLSKPVVSAYSGGFMDNDTKIVYVYLGYGFETRPIGSMVQVHHVPDSATDAEITDMLKRIYGAPDAHPVPVPIKKWGFVEGFTIPDLEEKE